MKYTNRYQLPEAFVRAVTNDQEERFWSKVDRRSDDECWEWLATKNACGYGSFQFFRKVTRAHRASYVMHKGPIPEGCVVMHSCDNPGCVNPAHLSVGTQRENVADCVRKNRRANLRGENHPRAKLTQGDVDAIRNAYCEGVRAEDLARAFGVKRGLIHDIMSRRVWRDE